MLLAANGEALLTANETIPLEYAAYIGGGSVYTRFKLLYYLYNIILPYNTLLSPRG